MFWLVCSDMSEKISSFESFFSVIQFQPNESLGPVFVSMGQRCGWCSGASFWPHSDTKARGHLAAAAAAAAALLPQKLFLPGHFLLGFPVHAPVRPLWAPAQNFTAYCVCAGPHWPHVIQSVFRLSLSFSLQLMWGARCTFVPIGRSSTFVQLLHNIFVLCQSLFSFFAQKGFFWGRAGKINHEYFY